MSATANITNIGLPNVRIIGGRQVGGLVGLNNNGSITNSYVMGSVSGSLQVGGLVGQNNNGSITNSYAMGSVSGSRQVGGLLGVSIGGSIINSYATGSVSGSLQVGGLLGHNIGGSIINSYATGFNTLVGLSQFASITNSSTKTEMELRTPTAATGIYSDWSSAIWDFGTERELPTLRDPPHGIRIRARVFLEGPLQ